MNCAMWKAIFVEVWTFRLGKMWLIKPILEKQIKSFDDNKGVKWQRKQMPIWHIMYFDKLVTNNQK